MSPVGICLINCFSQRKRQNTLRKTEEEAVLTTKAAPSLLALVGSIDWLTTIIGIVYFGAVEGNPFLADLTRTNLLAFSALKLGTAFSVGFLFYQAEKVLARDADKKSRSFKRMRYILRGAYIACIAFLMVAVANNVMIVANGAV